MYRRIIQRQLSSVRRNKIEPRLVSSHTTSSAVVPLSVMSNWEKQIEDHVQPGILQSCVYYGKTRSMTPAELKKHDVVITTYQTVAQELELSLAGKGGRAPAAKKQKTEKGLFDVAWKVRHRELLQCDMG